VLWECSLCVTICADGTASQVTESYEMNEELMCVHLRSSGGGKDDAVRLILLS